MGMIKYCICPQCCMIMGIQQKVRMCQNVIRMWLRTPPSFWTVPSVESPAPHLIRTMCTGWRWTAWMAAQAAYPATLVALNYGPPTAVSRCAPQTQTYATGCPATRQVLRIQILTLMVWTSAAAVSVTVVCMCACCSFSMGMKAGLWSETSALPWQGTMTHTSTTGNNQVREIHTKLLLIDQHFTSVMCDSVNVKRECVCVL